MTTAYYTVLGCGPHLPWYGLFVDWKLFDFLLNSFEHVEGPNLQLKPLPITAVKINGNKHSNNSIDTTWLQLKLMAEFPPTSTAKSSLAHRS